MYIIHTRKTLFPVKSEVEEFKTDLSCQQNFLKVPITMEPKSMENPAKTKGHVIWMGTSLPLRSWSVMENCWKLCNEEDQWVEMAVKYLMKMLISTNGAIEELQRALSCPGIPSKCVTILRTFNGRIQILNRKELPHVIYCRIWRWPDLQSPNELIPLPECQFAFSKNLSQVCVNPYHYERVNANILPPVMVPKRTNFVPGNCIVPLLQLSDPNTPSSSRLRPQNSNLVDWQPRTHNLVYSKLIEELKINGNQSKLQPPPQPINYEGQQVWASIYYCEFNNRVGEMFNCINTSVIVDGFTNPDENGDRFSVGHLSNLHGNSTTENVRKYIGKGIRINYVNGQVYVECLSNASIFVHSAISNLTNEVDPSNVCKISTGNTLKVFDNSKFAQLLSEKVHNNRDSVNQLSEMCIIGIAFVKGFGAGYSRANISSTPAWIEIHFHDPLKWLDRVLTEMEASTG